jgi:hypothetical protein
LPANRILGDYIDWCGDAAPSSRTKGQLAKYIGEMVNKDKIPAKFIKQGLHAWHERGKTPSSLTSFVDEARRRAGKPPAGRSVGADPTQFTEGEYQDVSFKSA